MKEKTKLCGNDTLWQVAMMFGLQSVQAEFSELSHFSKFISKPQCSHIHVYFVHTHIHTGISS